MIWHDIRMIMISSDEYCYLPVSCCYCSLLSSSSTKPENENDEIPKGTSHRRVDSGDDGSSLSNDESSVAPPRAREEV